METWYLLASLEIGLETLGISWYHLENSWNILESPWNVYVPLGIAWYSLVAPWNFLESLGIDCYLLGISLEHLRIFQYRVVSPCNSWNRFINSLNLLGIHWYLLISPFKLLEHLGITSETHGTSWSLLASLRIALKSLEISW